jgi:hypothetical protein
MPQQDDANRRKLIEDALKRKWMVTPETVTPEVAVPEQENPATMKFGGPSTDPAEEEKIINTLRNIQSRNAAMDRESDQENRYKILQAIGGEFPGGAKAVQSRYPNLASKITRGTPQEAELATGEAFRKIGFEQKDPTSLIPGFAQKALGYTGLFKPMEENRKGAAELLKKLKGSTEQANRTAKMVEAPAAPTPEATPSGEPQELEAMQKVDGGLESAATQDAPKIAAGAKTEDEADARMRSYLGGDEELQQAISEVRARLADAQKPDNYGVLDYVTAVLLTLGGSNPISAVEYVTQRGYKQARRADLEKQLVNLQVAGAGAKRRQSERAQDMGFQREMLLNRLGAQGERDTARQAFDEQKAGTSYYSRLHKNLIDKLAVTTDQNERANTAIQIAEIEKKLGIPQIDPRLKRMGLTPGGNTP